MDGLTASCLPKPGRVGLAYFADDRGRVVTEMSVIPHSDEQIWLITAAVAQWHDKELLERGTPGTLSVHDQSDKYDCLLVTGPKSREILSGLTDADLSLPWLSYQEAEIAGHRVVLLRVSFAGELGWEIHCASDAAPAIWDMVTAAGAKPFGMCALDSLRIEKGYRAWKGDLSTDYTLLEAGLERFIDFEKPDFPGKAALVVEREEGAKRCFVSLKVEAGEADAPYMSMLWHEGKIVGETTSGGWGHRVGASLALGMIRADLAAPGTEVKVEIYGKKYRAILQPHTAVWDADNSRIRA